MDSLTVVPLTSLDDEHGIVTAIHADGETVVVGTSRGQLLRLVAPDDLSMAERPVACCELRPEKQRKHAVRELCVLGSSGVALALSDGIVTVHCLLDLSQLCQLNNSATKAETFCVNEDLPIPCVAVSVAAQRALLFFRLSNPVQLYRETACVSPPSRMAWQGDALSLVSLEGLAVVDATLGYTIFEQGFGSGEGDEQQSRLARCHESQRWFPIKVNQRSHPIHMPRHIQSLRTQPGCTAPHRFAPTTATEDYRTLGPPQPCASCQRPRPRPSAHLPRPLIPGLVRQPAADGPPRWLERRARPQAQGLSSRPRRLRGFPATARRRELGGRLGAGPGGEPRRARVAVCGQLCAGGVGARMRPGERGETQDMGASIHGGRQRRSQRGWRSQSRGGAQGGAAGRGGGGGRGERGRGGGG